MTKRLLMINDKSTIISELAELYEFSLNIGTSLAASTNADTFFTSFAQRKNLKYISVWHRKEDVLYLDESFPKLQGVEDRIGHDSPLCQHFTILEEGKIHKIEEKNFCFSGFDAPAIWLYYSKNIYILFLQNEQDEEFSKREKSQYATLFKKFSVSMQACLAHEASLEEVLKRKEAEQKLFERESLFRFGANSLTEGIVVTDLDNRMTYVNNAMSTITGFSREEMIGAIGYELFKTVGFTNEILEEVVAKIIDNETQTYEVEQVKKDGSRYWVRIMISSFKDSKGISNGVIASMVDITEAYNNQRAIESNEKELKDLVGNMYDALIVVSSEGQITNINKAGEELLGYSKKEALKLDLGKIVHPNDAERSREYLKKLETEGFYSGYEGRIIAGDGSIKEVEVNSTAIVEGGKLIGSRDIVRDISERKDLERQRKLSETKLRLIIDTALDAVVTMNAEGNITEWNKNAEHIFGYSYDEVHGNKLSEFIIPEQYREAHERGMKHYFASGEGPVLNNRIEITAIDKEKREFPIELAITPAKQDGQTFFSAFIRDITDRKEIEAQKESLMGELESVNQELRDFAYIVSHDLKAPLRSIGSLSDWLIQDYTDVLDEEGKELLKLLKARIGRMHGLIEGVLQYSKVGRLKDEKEVVDINILLAETIDLLDPATHIEVQVDRNLPTVNYDKVRLQQVFQNLLSNAIKFLDKPKGLIKILFEEDESHYHFSIKDNGPGIEEAYFKKIFQIFQTLKAKDEYESTGIGLSIVKRIVELNGGSIQVSSEIGQGATFTFTIPKNK